MHFGSAPGLFLLERKVDYGMKKLITGFRGQKEADIHCYTVYIQPYIQQDMG